jgi:hypothetical protein
MFQGQTISPIVHVYQIRFVESLLLVPGSRILGTRARVEKALAGEVELGAAREMR